jgi:hypothetical protein
MSPAFYGCLVPGVVIDPDALDEINLANAIALSLKHAAPTTLGCQPQRLINGPLRRDLLNATTGIGCRS